MKPMECNMCSSGDMFHQYVLLNMKEQSVTIVDKHINNTHIYESVGEAVAAGRPEYNGLRIVHVYNCDECPNSQLEYYQPEDAFAYALAMAPILKLQLGGK